MWHSECVSEGESVCGGHAGEGKDGKKRAHSCSPAWNRSVESDSAQVHSVYRQNEQNMPVLIFILCPRQFPSNRNNNQFIRVVGNCQYSLYSLYFTGAISFNPHKNRKR